MQEKRLLYYQEYVSETQKGVVITTFYFRDVKKGGIVTLTQCKDIDLVSTSDNTTIYRNIDDAMQDYNILWHNTGSVIAPINSSFEEIQNEYRRLKDTPLTEEEIWNHLRNIHMGCVMKYKRQ